MTRLQKRPRTLVAGAAVVSACLLALGGCGKDPAPSPAPTQAPTSTNGVARGTCVEARTGYNKMHLTLPDGFKAIDGAGPVRMRRVEGATEVSIATLVPYTWARTKQVTDQELILRSIYTVGDAALSVGPEFTQASAALKQAKANEIEYTRPNPTSPSLQQVTVYATVRHQDEQRYVLALFAPAGEKFAEVKAKALATLTTGSCPKD